MHTTDTYESGFCRLSTVSTDVGAIVAGVWPVVQINAEVWTILSNAFKGYGRAVAALSLIHI